MRKISLADATEILRNMDGNLTGSEELMEFVGDVDKVGKKILSTVSDDELNSAVSLLQAIVTADLISDGEMMMAMMCMKDVGAFTGMMSIALKISVGIAASEEWR
jgi:hypothetical protein